MTTKKRKSTIMEILSAQGRSLVNEDEIVLEFVFFYMSLYTKDDSVVEFPHDLDRSPIDQHQAASLKVAFTKEEVRKALQFLGSGRIPRTRWFYLRIFNKSWKILRADIMSVPRLFTETGCLHCQRLLPLSLTIERFKIIGKVLLERFKKVLPLTITWQKTTFIEGWQILDASLMINAVIDEWERKKQKMS